MDEFKNMNDDPNDGSHRAYGTPVPPQPELGSVLPQNVTSSPLHSMDNLNPDRKAQLAQQAAEAQKPVPTYDELLGTQPAATQSQSPIGNANVPQSSVSQPAPAPVSAADARLRRKFRIMVILIVVLIVTAIGLYIFTLLNKK